MLDFLKPTPAPVVEAEVQPEAKPEVKPEATTMTLKARVLAYRDANPSATVVEIAKALNTSKPYVYQCFTDYKKTKKVKSLAEKIETALSKKGAEEKVAAPTVAQLNNQIGLLESNIRNLKSNFVELDAINKVLKHQNRGLSNVITYLESKLGIDRIEERLEATKD
jgi:hypothetical protein